MAWLGWLPTNSSLLLYCNGANNSTDFIDSSSNNHIITVSGTAKQKTDQYKYGTASAYFDGTSTCYIKASGAGDAFTFGTGDFTIEFFARWDNTTANVRMLISFSGIPWEIYTNGAVILLWNGGANLLSSGSVIAATTWHHIALTRSGTVLRLFVDGVVVGSATNSTNLTRNDFAIGNWPGDGRGFIGYIDEFKVKKGEALYTSNFAQPLSVWSYRKSVSLSRVSGSVTNYQMKLLVGESSGAVGEEVDCGGLCKSDFSDIRFTTSDGVTLLDYWIESISGTTPNQLATIWVEFNSIGSTATTFYMYYGNSTASSVSNGTNTFLFFDDFSGSSLDTTTNWTQTAGTTTVAGSVAKVNLTGSSMIYTKNTFATDTACRMLAKYSSNSSYLWFGPRTATDYAAGFYVNYTAAGVLNAVNRNTTPTYSGMGDVGNGGVYKIYEVKRNAIEDVRYSVDSTSVIVNTNVTSTALPVKIWAEGQDGYFDWVIVRKWFSVEPTWSAWSEAESIIVVYTCSGIVMVDDLPRTDIPVCLYRRSTGELVARKTTVSGGYFTIDSTYNEDHYVVALYTTSGTNAKIYDWISP